MSPKPISDNTLLGWSAGERRLETGWRWAELRRPFTGVEASKQAAGMEGVAGSARFVRSGAGSPNPGARAQACRPTAGLGGCGRFAARG